jgi:hypothetical protein
MILTGGKLEASGSFGIIHFKPDSVMEANAEFELRIGIVLTGGQFIISGRFRFIPANTSSLHQTDTLFQLSISTVLICRTSEQSASLGGILGRSVAFLKTDCERKLGVGVSFIGIVFQAVRILRRDLAVGLKFGPSS